MPGVLKASELGAYLYCRRAWWYQKRGVESDNQAELAAGTDLHLEHGRKVIVAGLLQTVGFVLLLAAAVLLVLALTTPLLK